MHHVVFCVHPAVRAASHAHHHDVAPSLVSVSHKLNGFAPHPAAELVRYSARAFAPLLQHRGGERAPWLAGYRVKSVEGNGLAARAHRMQELREATGRAWPGTSLVGDEPALGVVTEVGPCAHGPAQERALCGAVLDTVEAGALGMEDRHVGPRALLWEIDQRGACCVTREQQGFPCESVPPRRSSGRTPTGQVAQQRGGVVEAHGHKPLLRRRRIKVNAAPRNGATMLHLLTHGPRQGSAQQVAARSRKRWTLETAVNHLEASCHAAINT
jgi:hypothetical protein